MASPPSLLDSFGAFDPWPGNPMLYQTQLLSQAEASLPIGASYEWIGRRDGQTFYADARTIADGFRYR